MRHVCVSESEGIFINTLDAKRKGFQRGGANKDVAFAIM